MPHAVLLGVCHPAFSVGTSEATCHTSREETDEFFSAKSFGVCNWFPEHGQHLVVDADREAFIALNPAGKIFQHVGAEGEWLVVRYGANTYRVNPDVLRPVPAPAFDVGQAVTARDRPGVVADVTWHFKEEAPIYFLQIDGKRSSRRYSEAELVPA